MPEIPGYATQVFRAQDFTVVTGANMGDGLSAPETLCAGDIYRLAASAAPLSLLLEREGAGRKDTPPVTGSDDAPGIAAGSGVGTPGDPVAVLGELTLMAADGDQIAIAVVRTGSALLALPLTPLRRAMDYTLIRCAPPQDSLRLTDLACASFVRGTRITRADGTQAEISTLTPGDLILTRDHGPQPLRWIGRATLRAHGSFAPVVIGAGVLGNRGALSVSQHHRMFLYQRGRFVGDRFARDTGTTRTGTLRAEAPPGASLPGGPARDPARLAPRAEVLLQARYLVDGDRVTLRSGGFVDYVSLVFDRHEIIYAAGIPVESLLVSEATVTRLPDALAEDLLRHAPGLEQRQHIGTEPDTISPALLAQIFMARGRTG